MKARCFCLFYFLNYILSDVLTRGCQYTWKARSTHSQKEQNDGVSVGCMEVLIISSFPVACNSIMVIQQNSSVRNCDLTKVKTAFLIAGCISPIIRSSEQVCFEYWPMIRNNRLGDSEAMWFIHGSWDMIHTELKGVECLY